jgi:hypothetical protein
VKTYAQFFIQGVESIHCPNPGLIEACGDRSVIRLDGRMRQLTIEQIATEECRKRGFVAWQLIRGETLLRAKPFSRIVLLTH